MNTDALAPISTSDTSSALVSDRAGFCIASSKHPPINPVAKIFGFDRIVTSLISRNPAAAACITRANRDHFLGIAICEPDRLTPEVAGSNPVALAGFQRLCWH
jgi:hypothetical protein